MWKQPCLALNKSKLLVQLIDHTHCATRCTCRAQHELLCAERAQEAKEQEKEGQHPQRSRQERGHCDHSSSTLDDGNLCQPSLARSLPVQESSRVGECPFTATSLHFSTMLLVGKLVLLQLLHHDIHAQLMRTAQQIQYSLRYSESTAPFVQGEEAVAPRPKVTLMIPWLAKSDQKAVFPKGVIFNSPEEQEEYVRKWAEKRTGFESNFKVTFYPGRYAPEKGSILPVGDPTAYISDSEVSRKWLTGPQPPTPHLLLPERTAFCRSAAVVCVVPSTSEGQIACMLLTAEAHLLSV